MVTAPAAWASATVAYGGGPLRPGLSSTNRLAKSTLPMASPMGGMMTSSTNDFTMVPNAPPMMMPTARSSTLPRNAKALNSLSMGFPEQGSGLRAYHRASRRSPLGKAAAEEANVVEASGPEQAHRNRRARSGV